MNFAPQPKIKSLARLVESAGKAMSGKAMSKSDQSEPWLRGTLKQIPAVQRAVIHALELAAEDLRRWCGSLTDDQMNTRPFGLPAVAFHLRHISRSLLAQPS